MDMMSYLMGRNSGGAKKGAKIEVVTELPETGEANVIYLVPKETEDENNIFDEYLYINDEWELIGTTDIDLSGYATKEYANGVLNTISYIYVSTNLTGTFTVQGDNLKDLINIANNDVSKPLLIGLRDSSNNTLIIPTMRLITNKELATGSYADRYLGFMFCNNLNKNGYLGVRGVDFVRYWDKDTQKITNLKIEGSSYFFNGVKKIAEEEDVLTKTNTTSYTPTSNYHPATKKYVDDAVLGAGSDIIVFQDPERYNNTVSSMNNIEQNKTNLKRLADALKDGKSPLVYFDKVVMGSSGALITSPYRYLSMYKATYDETSDTYSFNFYTLYPTGFTDSYAYKYDTQYIDSLSYVYTAQSGTTQKFNSKQTYGGLLIAGSSEISRYPISSLYFNWALGLERYSSSKTYQIGDYIVSYNSSAQMSSQMCTIYKCNTADTTGTWDSSKWDEKTYMEYLSDKLVGGALNGSY